MTESKTPASASTYGDIACVAGLVLLPVLLTAATGNLTAVPRFVDDNQLFVLDQQLDAHGIAWTVREHFRERLFDMKRFVPVYLAHKLFQTNMFGTNLVAWSLYTALLGGATSALLFMFGRMIKLSLLESVCFAAVVVLGPQSVLWWRYLHGEGIGLFFLAAALVSMALATRHANRRNTPRALFVLFAVLASLSKESFILLLPALAFAYVASHQWARKSTWREAVREHAIAVSVLATTCIAELVVIRFALGTTYFHYAGWRGFDATAFAAAAAEFFSIRRTWLAIAGALGAIIVGAGVRKRFTTQEMEKVAIWAVLVFLIIAPQLLLYMRSGFSGSATVNFSRFLVPATLGLAVSTVFPIHWVRQRLEHVDYAGHRSVRTAAKAVFPILIGVYLLTQLATATQSAVGFAQETEKIEELFVAITDNIDEDDLVLVVAGNPVKSARHTRVMTLLTQYLNLQHVYCLPVTDDKDYSGIVLGWSAIEGYSFGIEASVLHGRSEGQVDSVIIADQDEQHLESAFLKQEEDWFDPNAFERFENARGDVAYFLKDR